MITQSCPTLCNPCSSVRGILQARRLEWVAISFSRGSSRLRDWTWVTCIAGRFFTVWAIRKSKWKWKSLSCVGLFATLWTIQSMEFSRPDYWSGWSFPSPGDLPNPGIKPRSPALRVDSLPAEPQGKPKNTGVGSLSLFQQIFPTQDSNQGLLQCRRILYQLNYQGSSPHPRPHPSKKRKDICLLTQLRN